MRGPSFSSSSSDAKSRSSRSYATASTAPEPLQIHVAPRGRRDARGIAQLSCASRQRALRDRSRAIASMRVLRRPARGVHQVLNHARLRSPTMPVCGSQVKSRTVGRVPVIAPRQPRASFIPCCTTAHSPVGRDDEGVQVDLKAVGDRVVVDARGQPAGAHERVAVEAAALGDRAQFVRRVARMPAAAAADVDAQFVRARIRGRASARPSPTW